MSADPIGGGIKKVLYTLQTAQKIGLRPATKALKGKNTCKACGYGMGGQMGGMTNELGEFPSVCNKSVQAQLTDIQPAIPAAVFEHTLDELQELTPHELEHMGRLGFPIHKKPGSERFCRITWEEALEIGARRFCETDPHRTFFYSSGRSSNEAGFLFQLLARVYGTNNVNNCSYYCHQATSVALAETIGTGTSTVELADLDKCDLIFVIGANPASNHPRFIHKLKACRERGGHVVIINPAKEPALVKFAVPKDPRSLLSGGTEIASHYLQPRIGQDISLFKGLAKALIAADAIDTAFINQYTDGFDEFSQDILETDWDMIVTACGISRDEIERVADIYASADSAVFAWGMGMTHHRHGVKNIEYIADLCLVRGMVGRPGCGLLPLRGHSNVQGIGTIGVKPVLPEEVIARMEAALGITLPVGGGMDTMAAMQAAADGQIDACILMGGNLYAANPDAAWAARALQQIGFKLSMTTTLNKGHLVAAESGESLILPVTARDEEWEPTTQESMFNFVRLSDGGIKRLADARPETRILADLAMHMLPDSKVDFEEFRRHRHIRQAIAASVPGMEQLSDIDIAKKEFHIRNRLMHRPSFRTASGKARFKVHDLPPAEDTGFVLTTMRSEGQFNSMIYEEKDSYRGTLTRWCVLMNPKDIADLGLSEGGTANVRSAQGEMKGVQVAPFNLPQGNVMAYYPEANILTSTAVDPRSKTPAFKATRVEIEPA